jgi:hypothetical protein
MSDDFLSRWSRRKRGLGSVEKLESTETLEESLSPEAIAALPSLDSLGPDSNMLAFLQKGVPAALRNAALRKAWALDPRIRDYVSDALDYAYDWNVPGGVPGNGPLLPSDDVIGMVERIFGRPSGQNPASAEQLARQSEAETGPKAENPAPSELPGGEKPTPMSAEDPVRLSGPIEPALEPDTDDEPVSTSLPVRRHGSARPV